jgi:opacity protein-like surface antigen
VTGSIRLAAVLAFLMLPLAAPAYAEAFTDGLYTVIGYDGTIPHYASIPYVSTPSYLDGLEVNVGWRFNPFYSVETSYTYATGSSMGGDLSTTLQSGAINALGYLPFGRDSSWALFGEAGAVLSFAHAQSNTVDVSGNKSGFGGQAGGGLQYQFDDNIGLRLSGRYVWTGISEQKSAEIFSLGLVWQR